MSSNPPRNRHPHLLLAVWLMLAVSWMIAQTSNRLAYPSLTVIRLLLVLEIAILLLAAPYCLKKARELYGALATRVGIGSNHKSKDRLPKLGFLILLWIVPTLFLAFTIMTAPLVIADLLSSPATHQGSCTLRQQTNPTYGFATTSYILTAQGNEYEITASDYNQLIGSRTDTEQPCGAEVILTYTPYTHKLLGLEIIKR